MPLTSNADGGENTKTCICTLEQFIGPRRLWGTSFFTCSTALHERWPLDDGASSHLRSRVSFSYCHYCLENAYIELDICSVLSNTITTDTLSDEPDRIAKFASDWLACCK